MRRRPLLSQHGGRREPQPKWRQPPPPQPSSAVPSTNPNPNSSYDDPSVQLQNLLVNTLLPNLQAQQNPNPYFPNPHQNAYFPVQNPTLQPHQQISGSAGQQQSQVPNFPQGFSKQGKREDRKDLLDRAAEKAWRDLVAAKESVSAWKVSQAALVELQADSLGSLGFRMQEVPSLHRLMVTEGKINSFIHCFVGVQRITTLYDLEVAICKNEGVEHFDELELGPLLQHPLVLHYFSVNSDATEVFKITSEEIILDLCEFMDISKRKDIAVDEFLEFIARKRSVMQKGILGVRIHSLGMHISFVREAKGSEKEIIKKCVPSIERNSNKKGRKLPYFASQKRHLDERFSAISQRVESFSSLDKDFCGKHIRFVSSSEEDDSSDGTSEDEPTINNGSEARFSEPSVFSSERASGCPYPSATEEMARLGLCGQKSPGGGISGGKKNGRSSKKKRKLEDINSFVSKPSKLSKEDSSIQIPDPFTLPDSFTRAFITTWKVSCKEQNMATVLTRMVQFYRPGKGYEQPDSRKNMTAIFSSYPLIGLLNVAVSSIKSGMWDSIYDTFHDINQHELMNSHSSEFERIDVESAEEHTPVVPEQHAPQKMARLELSDQKSPEGEISSKKKNGQSSEIKRKFEDINDTFKHYYVDEASITLPDSSINEFIKTWKEICKERTIPEVLTRMAQFYRPKKGYHQPVKRKTMKAIFSSYPVIGLLNVAVSSIKSGMWDSIYDTFRDINQHELMNTHSPECAEFERIDVEPAEEHTAIVSEHRTPQTHSVTVEEITGKISMYYVLHPELQSNSKSPLQDTFISWRKLCNCESWLVDQFGAKEFKCLGYGEFFVFIEKHVPLLPTECQNLLANKISEKSSLEVCMSQNELITLVSQASNNLWENEIVNKQMISSLLTRQCPLFSFKIMENDSMEGFLKLVGQHRNEVISKCVIFSASMLGDSSPFRNDYLLEATAMRTDGHQKTLAFKSVTYKDAIEALIGAPKLSDLNLWSHWDQIFAPSLGPLIGWLLSEVNSKELLCLVTKDGKVIRIDPSATADSFLNAALQMSSFETAVNLLSLFSLSGGEKHVPLSLIKCYAQRAFKANLSDNHGKMDVEYNKNSLLVGKMVDDVATNEKDMTNINNVISVASRFVIDCLGYLPSEFRGFAADILLFGMQSLLKDVPSAILCVCNQIERLMLHDIGLSIGILEWIDDYNAFCFSQTTESMSSGKSHPKAASSDMCIDLKYKPNVLGKLSYADRETVPNVLGKLSYADGETVEYLRGEECNKECTEAGHTMDDASISNDKLGNSCREQLSDSSKHKDATMLIESIRRDEFGLDPNLSGVENNMLKKQHARLGRALHCLSQELYSQDSHFLLELVQNADDNNYPANVEPTLTFVLEESGIIVLNNEQGFSARNIRALCDVGNSTKKGSGAGYIGQKGIGFKSVFRVTDAPEIHSNGFHIKFDISEGQIGFVLPTIVPPFNVEMFSDLLSGDAEQMKKKCWNTCIVLPFRSKFSGETAMNMFSDLHPSLLLFLHRLECIMFRNMLNDSLIVMRKETLADGIVKVSCGKEKMTWLVASQKLQAHASRPKVQTTEIAVAFTLEESDNGNYSPHLDQQPVFAFLPLRTYGLKFILQGDFVLPSSREEVDKNNPWNEWLLINFPALFVSAEKEFCALSCFRNNPGKAVTTFMSFVPLVGEVHGFFSRLPKAIILELRKTGCLLLEGDKRKMVPPCNVLRGWNEQARNLLPDDLLQQHLGLGFLDKNIVLSDSLARALGILEYGPEILVRFMTSLCCTKNGLKSMGLGWLAFWLSSLYTMISLSSEFIDLVDNLQHIPFIPLSDGTYSSVDVGTIWLHSDAICSGFNNALGLESFPNLHAELRTVNPLLLSASSVEGTLADNVKGMLQRIGVQQLTAHEIMKVHILPAVTDKKITFRNNNLMIDYLCFLMIHLQSSCSSCHTERMYIISELRSKAYMLTNYGYKRLLETPIHFSKEFGNPINVAKLVDVVAMRWHEVDCSYLQHPANESLSNAQAKWREFFQDIGVSDFVQVVQVDKSFSDLSNTVFKKVMWDTDLISSGIVAKDWESHELIQLLSFLSASGDRERCKYLLEIVDTLWDDSFSDKVTGVYNLESNADSRSFTSSFLYSMHDVQWVASTMDNKLHYPKDLFYDSDMVQSILGAAAPYALPKVKNEKLVRDIGFKTKVTLDDVLECLRVWRNLMTPFKASITQMSKLYAFIWKEMAASKNKISEAILSGPFIFVPCETGSKHEDLVPGFLLSSEEVYWHDPVCCADQIKGIHPQFSLTSSEGLLSKMLCKFYPGLHEFFVKDCGVREFPSCHGYLDILRQLSVVTLPSQSASVVFQVFLRWADELKSGLLSSEDIRRLKECFLELEYTVLPTVQDKWVSLHPSFGLVCWCDDKKLVQRFKKMDNIDFLYFGNLSDHEQDIFQAKMSDLLQNLGIPALSEVITREAIYYGLADNNSKASLINWALPYAQRYVYSVHTDKYSKLKQSGFSSLKQLKVIVVEKLFYRNVIKGSAIASEKRYECSCLLQGNTLYATGESDSHALYLELSRLFFDDSPDLHMANFLHMITTMAESGSNEEQTEFFIVNSQNVLKLPDDEPIWPPLSIPCLTEDYKPLENGVAAPAIDEQRTSKLKKKAGISSNWPPADWKTAPDFSYARANGFKTQAVASHHNRADGLEDSCMAIVTESNDITSLLVDIDSDWIIEENNAAILSQDVKSEEAGNDVFSSKQTPNVGFDGDDFHINTDGPEPSSSRFCRREQLNSRISNPEEAMRIGRLGEHLAYKYLSDKVGKTSVKWVNEDKETGLPYDIIIGEGEGSREFVEVKATKSAKKDWFFISMREWQFAIEKGESFSIAHVSLVGNNAAKVKTFRNPVKQCQLGNLQLVVMMPRQQE